MSSVADRRDPGTRSLVERLVLADGSGVHRWPVHLAGTGAARRDLADAVHALCMLHGHHPGIADDARDKGTQPAADDWLHLVAGGFAAERATLAALVSSAGPLPSTPGHAASEGTIVAQRHALATLARSDRAGCATGAVAALVLEWPAIRRVLARAATSFGTPLDPASLPGGGDCGALLGSLGGSPAAERAIGFGAQQLLAQHRGLWGLLEARAEARGPH